jgi:hypothetical protein
MASKVEIKENALSFADKLDMIKKVNTQPHVTQIKLVEELGIPVLTLNNINNILQQGRSSEPNRTNNF